MTTAYPKMLYNSRLDDATPVASTTATGYSVLNLRDWRSYTAWQPTALPATVTVDCGSAVAADYWLIYGHDLFTQGCTIEVRGSTDNFAASNVLVDTVTPASNANFVRHFASASYRYWRFRITGAATMPSIQIAAVGVAMDIPAYLSSGFDPIGREPMGAFSRSETGQPLGRTVQWEKWSQDLTFEALTWTWLRDTWEPAWDAHLLNDPFVFQWDPSGHAAEIFLVNTEGGFKAPHGTGSYLSLSFRLTAKAGA